MINNALLILPWIYHLSYFKEIIYLHISRFFFLKRQLIFRINLHRVCNIIYYSSFNTQVSSKCNLFWATQWLCMQKQTLFKHTLKNLDIQLLLKEWHWRNKIVIIVLLDINIHSNLRINLFKEMCIKPIQP